MLLSFYCQVLAKVNFSQVLAAGAPPSALHRVRINVNYKLEF